MSCVSSTISSTIIWMLILCEVSQQVDVSALLCNMTGQKVPKDCDEVYARGDTCSGLYLIKPPSSPLPFDVYCDMTFNKGGWTLLMRRYNGSVGFYRDWEAYKNGFGQLDGEFWLGNEYIHQLTHGNWYTLRIEVTHWKSKLEYYAEYKIFMVQSESSNYRLHVTGTSGNMPYKDNFVGHDVFEFSTKDRDNDLDDRYNCAVDYQGGFWYGTDPSAFYCHHNWNPTGIYKAECSNYDCMLAGGPNTKLLPASAFIMKIRKLL